MMNRILAIGLVASALSMGCYGSESDSSDEDVDTAENAVTGSLDGCKLTALAPDTVQLADGGGYQGWVYQAYVELSCPTPRKTFIKGQIWRDSPWYSDSCDELYPGQDCALGDKKKSNVRVA